MTLYETHIKRSIDILLVLISMAIASPVMVVAAAAIWFEDGVPVIFKQRRAGRDGKVFTIFKFRSMPKGTANVPSATAHTLKVTRVGKVIRRTNIDELPQLWNVLRGDMSLIGPRPALESQTTLLDGRAKLGVDKVRPGLTGLAQVNSYDGMPEGEKLDWEARYVRKISFRTDLAIVLRTFMYLARRPPAY